MYYGVKLKVNEDKASAAAKCLPIWILRHLMHTHFNWHNRFVWYFKLDYNIIQHFSCNWITDLLTICK